MVTAGCHSGLDPDRSLVTFCRFIRIGNDPASTLILNITTLHVYGSRVHMCGNQFMEPETI